MPMKFLKLLSFGILCSLLFSLVANAIDSPYPDSYIGATAWNRAEDIFEGDPDGDFRWGDEMNRAELTKVLVLGSGILEIDVAYCAGSATITFPDVPEDEWYTDYVYCAQSKGWVSGDDYTKNFRAGDPIKMVETFKVIVESQLGTPDKSYEGLEWYDLYLNYLLDQDIIEQINYGSLVYTYYSSPSRWVGFESSDKTSKMQRADIAELLYRMHHVLDENDGEPLNWFKTLEEMEDAFETSIEVDEDEDTFSLTDPTFGYTLENIPLKDEWDDDIEENIRFYITAPVDYEDSSTSVFVLYPDSDDPDSSGYSEYFSVTVAHEDYDPFDGYSLPEDFVSEDEEYYYEFDCIGFDNCNPDDDTKIDADYVEFAEYSI